MKTGSTDSFRISIQIEFSFTVRREISKIIGLREKAEDMSAFSVHTNTVFMKTEPVHENITLAALIASEYPVDHSMTYSTASSAVWEIFRGVIWNDDPSCDLFHDSADQNNEFAWDQGVTYGTKFQKAKSFGASRSKAMLGRSHFGDLQFLHAMGCERGEVPNETLSKVLLWCETMYKLAVGDQGVSAGDQIMRVSVTRNDISLHKFFDDHTTPKGSDTLHTLLTCNSKYEHLDVQSRALGSLFHVIQDSYAHGHTKRVQLDGKLS